MRYEELTDRERFNLNIDEAKAYVDNGEVTWDSFYKFTKEYAAMLDKDFVDEEDSVLSPGRPIEYPESKRHAYNRGTQSRYQTRQRSIRDAMGRGVVVGEEIKKDIISKIAWLNANGVSVVMGRLVKEMDQTRLISLLGDKDNDNKLIIKDWFIPYAVEVMVEEGRLVRSGKVIRIVR